ncbi:MAG: fatty acid desaturase [Synechococcales bacterium]|nr:fatty acid desaturase [Synechococcales bacterium]
MTAFKLIHQADYAKALRPLLPAIAFQPHPAKLWILFTHLGIMLSGWAIAAAIPVWHWQQILVYLPLSLIMGNSVLVLAFVSHDLLHGSIIRNQRVAYWLGLIGYSLHWTPPTLWQIVHNRTHHPKTNSVDDPDRNYLFQQPNSLGKRVQSWLVPSSEVTFLGWVLGMLTAWGVHTARNVVAAIFFGGKTEDVPAPFPVKPREQRQIAIELAFITLIHLLIGFVLGFNPLKLAIAYFLPISLGYAGMIFYIYTNHLFLRMTDINDPLINSVSLTVPKWVDWLHLNFSYHAEHHVFPGLNSDYYPEVRRLLAQQYPDRMNYIYSPQAAWHHLLSTPRQYKDETTFINWQGDAVVACPNQGLPLERVNTGR